MDREDQDSALVKAALRREKGAFDALVLRHMDRVFNLCHRYLGDQEEARDCAQETFLKAYRSLDRFRFEAAFGTWLYAIALNVCRNHVGSAAHRMQRRSSPLHQEDMSACAVDLEDPAPSLLDQLSLKERNQMLQRAIADLPDGPRTLVILRDVEGCSYEEIGRITGSNPGTVKSGLARARARLRERLKGVCKHGMS